MSTPNVNSTSADPRAGEIPRRRAARWVRYTFRAIRLFALSVILAILCGLVYVNQVGVPTMMHTRLVERLRQAGWDLELGRVRWRWHDGIVAEDLQLQRTNAGFGPYLFVEEAQCRFKRGSGGWTDWEVGSVYVHGARLVGFLERTNQLLTGYVLNEVAGDLRFLTHQVWELASLEGRTRGVHVRLTGTITNAALIRDWKFSKPGTRKGEGGEEAWRRVARTLDQFQFTGAPLLVARFHGDAADFKSFRGQINLAVPEVTSRWASGTNLTLSAHLVPPTESNASSRVELAVGAEMARLPWGQAQRFGLKAVLEPSLERLLPTNSNLRLELHGARTPWANSDHMVAELTLHPDGPGPGMATLVNVGAEGVHTRWGSIAHAQMDAIATHAATNWRPASIAAKLDLQQPRTRWAAAQRGEAQWRIDWLASDGRFFDTNLPWAERIHAASVESSTTLENAEVQKLTFEKVTLTNHWRFPDLQVGLHGLHSGRKLDLSIARNAPTGDTTFTALSTLDPYQYSSLFPTNAQQLLSQFACDRSPMIELTGRCVVPPYTNAAGAWFSSLSNTLTLRGSIEGGACSYRTIAFTDVRSTFALTNGLLELPAFMLTRPEGVLEGAGGTSIPAQQFHVEVRSGLDPNILRPLFPNEKQQRVFEFLSFSTPPRLEASIKGSWKDLDQLNGTARVEATNFLIRGEPVSYARAVVDYTNRQIRSFNPVVNRPGESGTADLVLIDLRTQKLYLTNANGNLDPYALTRTIGKKSAQAILPYKFEQPPVGVVNGVVDLKKGRHEEDMHFQIAGGRFHWHPFNVDALSGTVHWVGKELKLAGVRAAMHGGEVSGNAHFKFRQPAKGAELRFSAVATNIDLQLLMGDLSPKTNQLEGALSGLLTITEGESQEPDTWLGGGHVHLRDGLIWDIPIFGLFSPVLNAFAPGLGNSRARQGHATYAITNGTVLTDDLDIRATAMRMQFKGAITFSRNVDGRMEAELLRDIPAVGFFISKLLWPVTKLFEYRVTGTLSNPKPEPLWIIPRIVFLPFRPMKTLKELFEETNQQVAPESRSEPPLAPQPLGE